MRRLFRISVNTVTVLSALLCVAAVGLWVRSYLARDEVRLFAQSRQFDCFLITSRGLLMVEASNIPFQGKAPPMSWQAMSPAKKFCVNVLRDDQAGLCWRFAKSGVGDGRFDDVTWTHSPTGCPIIEGVGAWIDCTVEHQFELGDHYMVVGRVIDLDHHADPHTPLVFYKGSLGGFLAAE